jgi:hypothetical protein
VKNKAKLEIHTYCKQCGNQIDSKTRKCSGCGKQYFYLPRVTIIRVIAVTLMVVLVGANVYQYITNQRTEAATSEIIKHNDTLIASYKDSVSSLTSTNSKQLEALSFWNSNAVICTTTGTKYHHYGCEHLVGVTKYYIFNKEYAISRGYTPCLDCASALEKMDIDSGFNG